MTDSDPFNGDEEAALSYAIALSLQESESELAKGNGPVVLNSDDEDEDEDDLDKAPIYRPKGGKDGQPENSRPNPAAEPPSAASGLATFGLDRKKMEEERLARLGKRKALDSDQAAQPAPQKPKLGTSSRVITAISSQPVTTTPHATAGLPFPKGVVKKTWAYGYPRTGDDIKIEEVLQKDKLELAVISSFMWDEEWLLSKIDIKKTRMYLVAFASSKEQQDEMKTNVPKSSIRFCFPPMLPYGSMHSKLLLLKYPNYLRIAVPSGNFMSFDWGETGVMENMVFIIDLPRIRDSEAQETNQFTMFGEELCYFLEAQGLEKGLVQSLKNYDFSETSHYAFVHTIGSSHIGDKWKRTGYCGLGRAVKALGLGTSTDVEIDLVVSSLGSINKDLVSAICYAAQGDDGLKEYRERTTKAGKSKAGESTSSTWTSFMDKLRIYFPSNDTVLQSRGGKQNAGTISAQKKWWDAATFPRELFHDCKSVRSGMLMHNKLMLVRPRGSGKAWGYVGSANLSESAWGRLTKEKQSGNPKLTCRNWECGVLVPAANVAGNKANTATESLDVFKSSIPVPIVVPGDPYGKTGSKRPWFFM